MRVLLDGRPLQSASGGRGIGRYVAELARHLPQAGGIEEVLLLLDRSRPDPPGLPQAEGLREARVRRLPGPASITDRLQPAGGLAALGADVFHATYLAPPRVPAGMATVMTVHDLIPLERPAAVPWRAGLVFRLAFAQASACERVVAVSRATARAVRDQLGVPGEKVVVTPLGVDVGRFRVEGASGGPGWGERYLLHVGGFDPAKNLGLLLDVMERLVKDPRHRELKLVIAGSGGDRARELAAEAARRGLAGNLALPGRLDDDALARAYGGATLFLFPSLAEGFGLPALEAQAAGCPVLASRAASLPEVVGEAGRLLPPDDPEAWHRAVEELLADDARRSALAAAGRKRAARFTWLATAEATARAYREAMEVA